MDRPKGRPELFGRVVEAPQETRESVRFMARFSRDTHTEVIAQGSAKKTARSLHVGDRISISVWGRIGHLKIGAREILNHGRPFSLSGPSCHLVPDGYGKYLIVMDTMNTC